MKVIRAAAIAAMLYAPAAFAGSPDIPTVVIHPEAEPSTSDTILMIRGQYALMALDILAARRFFLGPASHGNIYALRRLAQSYDPVWLVRAGVIPAESFADPELCYELYKRAAALGDRLPDNRYVQAQAGD